MRGTWSLGKSSVTARTASAIRVNKVPVSHSLTMNDQHQKLFDKVRLKSASFNR